MVADGGCWTRTQLHDVGRNVRRALRGGVQQAAARYSLPTAAAVRRISGSDATAIFLLGFVRACPGQPMKFLGQYSILGQFWSILKFLIFWA
ncbi:multidrug resistance protein [Dorcoceras hygrometricum]|uniref:Multidrug resistance protein n=1 Tax=Dorcoceras hygrometricum TaxID=472368 RepID=A0A2Z7AZJ3_9LAMI|nr:multidrug resistance protein [Dorcoceras hygrometricum]